MAKKNPSGLPAPVDEKVAESLAGHGTSTPVGMSFWTTLDTCKRKFAYKYIEGYYEELEIGDARRLGSGLHKLLETGGKEHFKGLQQVERIEVMRLFEARKRGPPLGKLVSREQLYFARTALFPLSVRPDRIELHGEEHIVRDFKSANRLTEYDAEKWAPDPVIIAQLVALGLKKAIVDITTKDAAPRSSLIHVELTPQKENVFAAWMMALWQDFSTSWKMYTQHGDVEKAFARRPSACFQYGKPCPYWYKCWRPDSAAALAMERKVYDVWVRGMRHWALAHSKADVVWLRKLELK